MARFGFIGPSYTSQSINVESEECINLYPEIVESGKGPNKVVLYRAPGLTEFCELPTSPVRALWSNNITDPATDRVFAAAGSKFYEIFDDGTFNERGDIGSGTGPVLVFADGDELFIIANDKAYRDDGATIAQVFDTELDPLAARSGGFLDNYFMVANPLARTFQISELLDSAMWDPQFFATKEGYPDYIERLLVDHKEVWLFGSESTEVWYDSGNADFPFQPIPGAFIDQGCASKWSVARLDNSVFWLGSDSRGQGVVWRSQGYNAVRISTHAMEYALSQYEMINDAEAWVYQDQGHAFYVLTFPTGDETWVYDCSTQLWHKRGYWVVDDAVYHRHRARCHAFGFGKHLVGDHTNGKIYEMATGIYHDDGNPQRWLRRAPHINQEQVKHFYHRFQLDMETGVGLNDDLDPDLLGADPQVALRWSDDGGHTFSSVHLAKAGRIGEYKTRVIWRRLGAGRDRVFECYGTDPVKIALIDAYVQVEQGTN